MTEVCPKPHCPDVTLHVVADAPLRPLADLLRAAIEIQADLDAIRAGGDDYCRECGDPPDHLTDAQAARFDALRAAVRVLEGK